MEISITYLLNSGFMVKINQTLLIFDDYQDPSSAVEKAISRAKKVYFFASHAHFDHFDLHIKAYAPLVHRYFFSTDIREVQGVQGFPQEKITYLDPYDHYVDAQIEVITYHSTDAGTSFLVSCGGVRIFHAGDFNWWHWLGDSEKNQRAADHMFRKQMKKIESLTADVAFFPIDGRLEDTAEWGAKEFCHRTKTGFLVAMHRVGYPVWVPAKDFFAAEEEIPYWSPKIPGECRKIQIEGEFER